MQFAQMNLVATWPPFLKSWIRPCRAYVWIWYDVMHTGIIPCARTNAREREFGHAMYAYYYSSSMVRAASIIHPLRRFSCRCNIERACGRPVYINTEAIKARRTRAELRNLTVYKNRLSSSGHNGWHKDRRRNCKKGNFIERQCSAVDSACI